VAETVTWIDPDGATTVLTTFLPVTGRFMPPIAFEEEGVPEQPGLRLRAVRHQAREFVIPVLLRADSDAELRAAIRDLVARMDPTRGDGIIRVTAPGGDQREIVCRYAGGLELTEEPAWRSQKAAVVFRAHDPYWRATSDTQQIFESGDSAGFFPFFPLRLTSSEIFADATVTNTGDVETWPVWTITGPGSAIVLRNLSTGKQLSLSVTLGGGESVVIDTRPGAKTVTRSDGTNVFPALSAVSSLWPLRRGSNAVRVEMTSATADSSVTLAWRPRYLGA
jgi:hypothetical protein